MVHAVPRSRYETATEPGERASTRMGSTLSRRDAIYRTEVEDDPHQKFAFDALRAEAKAMIT